MHSQPVYPSYLSHEAIDFMAITMDKDPSKRPSTGALLFHPWLGVLPRSNSLNPGKSNIAVLRGYQ